MKSILTEYQRTYRSEVAPCGRHVETGIFDSVLSTFFISKIQKHPDPKAPLHMYNSAGQSL